MSGEYCNGPINRKRGSSHNCENGGNCGECAVAEGMVSGGISKRLPGSSKQRLLVIEGATGRVVEVVRGRMKRSQKIIKD